MTTVALIRHGVTEWNVLGKAQGITDIPLNLPGERQAFALAERLSKEGKWDMIVSSDLLRAKETANIISRKLDALTCIFDERIREINCGDIEGTTEEERIKKWGKNWREQELGMEKFEEVSVRGSIFLDELVTKYKNKHILVVSHGALIGLTLRHILPEKFTTTYIENASITLLTYMKNEWNCSLYNCTNHLVY